MIGKETAGTMLV